VARGEGLVRPDDRELDRLLEALRLRGGGGSSVGVNVVFDFTVPSSFTSSPVVCCNGA